MIRSYLVAVNVLAVSISTLYAHADFLPGQRVLLDAHNCYPYTGMWTDRIDRALGTGVPLAIEQDLVWYTDPGSGKSWSIVSHGKPFNGKEPTLKEYFFERIRGVVETALASGDRTDWPLVTLNLDFKDDEPEHVRAIWDVLGEYEPCLTTAVRTTREAEVTPLTVGPVLVLAGGGAEQQRVFHDEVPVGAKLRVFGQARTNPMNGEGLSGAERAKQNVTFDPARVLTEKATNYRRWWNHPWSVVEMGGQRVAESWTPEEEARLRALVDHAHALGYWIRFYTLDGFKEPSNSGWGAGYNFGSEEAARVRWEAAIEAGVDFVATDQYEAFAAMKRGK
ncbi:MAG: hypothetical protein AMXMBFR84_08220 [Candidatus Hydrogenedentota bacterium]